MIRTADFGSSKVKSFSCEFLNKFETKSPRLLKFPSSVASKKSFVLAYTLSAMVFTASGSYTNGIISTLEKQYRLSSIKIGIVYAMEDFMSGIIAVVIPYYTSKGHYPRWISFGLFLLGISLVFQSLPYAIYGPGSDALSLTEEFGTAADLNLTLDILTQKRRDNLCFANSESKNYNTNVQKVSYRHTNACLEEKNLNFPTIFQKQRLKTVPTTCKTSTEARHLSSPLHRRLLAAVSSFSTH